MNPDELKSTTLDPNHRRMIQLDMKDFESTDEVFDILMSKKKREVRRKISMESSINVNYEDLDI